MNLNLAYPERSDIKYEVINFPDGHKHLKILNSPYDQEGIIIKSRFNNMDDFFLIVQAWSILKNNGNRLIKLYIPYLFTARCDRRFSLGEANDLILIGHLINQMDFVDVVSLDVHNYRVCLHIIKHFKSSDQTFKDELKLLRSEKNALMAYPDLGSVDRCRYGVFDDCIFGIKERDNNGNIISYSIKNKELNLEKIKGRNIIVRDDLIDGGATFIELAKILIDAGAIGLYLFITHGIFSKGYEDVLKYYDHIWCTNSYKEINHPDITCTDVY